MYCFGFFFAILKSSSSWFVWNIQYKYLIKHNLQFVESYKVFGWILHFIDLSVHIATNVVSLNPAHGEVYLIQYYVICRWLSACQWFSPGTLVSSTNKTDRHDITEILLKVVLTTITHQFLLLVFHLLSVKNLDVKFLKFFLTFLFVVLILTRERRLTDPWPSDYCLGTKREWIESKYDNNLFFDIIYPKDIICYSAIRQGI